MGLQQYIVKPTKVDTKDNNDESILSEQITTETSLTDDLVKNAGVPLETAIKQVIKHDQMEYNLSKELIKSMLGYSISRSKFSSYFSSTGRKRA